jgi:hypothetical protein
MPANPEILNKLTAYIADKTGGNPPTGGDKGGTAAGGANAVTGGPVVPIKTKPQLLRINDIRKINPTTGIPFTTSQMGGKTTSVDPATLKAVIAHAKAKGIDPYTALAIAYQESEFGKGGNPLGQAPSYNPDQGIPESDTTNIEASRLANALKDKLGYAKRLGYDKKGETFALQAYNGYGDLRHLLMKVGGKMVGQKLYGNMVTPDKPFLMSDNPLYGKTIVSLRDEILKKHEGIKQLVDTTPAYGLPATPPPQQPPIVTTK